jgi:hypothetical protein
VYRFEIAVVCSVAELLRLTSLHLLHGGLGPEVDLSHWSSLRSLAELKLLPGEEGGLNEQQVITVCRDRHAVVQRALHSGHELGCVRSLCGERTVYAYTERWMGLC